MHLILVSVGTGGDVIPYVGLGARLRSRGHQATLVASAQYASLAAAHELNFQPLVSAQEHDALFNHPDFWKPLKTVTLTARWGARLIRRQYDLLSKLITPEAVLVANPALFAAALVGEKSGTRLIHLILQPGIIPSSIAPPTMAGLTFLRRAPRLVWKGFWRGLDVVGHLFVGRELNRLRASLALPPMRRMFQNWLSPELVLGMFPDWYAPPQADWPPQIRLAGFPMFDGGDGAELPGPVLEFCRAGAAPLAVTCGTGMAHSARLFGEALEACALLGQRAVLLTKFKDQLPDSLPPSVMHCGFAPFQQLFPLCAGVVHHGGIGTTAKALAAGIPQLIRPLCFDQFDNGVRVQRLGAGDWLKPGRSAPRRMAAALARLLRPEFQPRCRAISARCQDGDGLDTAARCIEDLACRPAQPAATRIVPRR